MNAHLKFAFFGGEPLGVPVLEELEKAGLLPQLVICNPDRPVGRKQELTPPPVKVWAEEHGIEVFQPTNYKDETTREKLEETTWDAFVVVAYNFILPGWLLELPEHGSLNVHPSLLPKLRGASPIRTAILNDERDSVGVTVMLLDEKMDHGPILDQIVVPIDDDNWPLFGPEIDIALAKTGGALLAATLPAWVTGEIQPQEQDHTAATYCGRLHKSDSELAIDPLNLPSGPEAKQAWVAINAFAGIGDTFFVHQNKRVKIITARLSEDSLELLKVIPEGKKETDFNDYLNTLS